jgi:hypothetical protein
MQWEVRKTAPILIWNLSASKCFDDLTELLASFHCIEKIVFDKPRNQAIQSFISKLDRGRRVPIVWALIPNQVFL